MTRIWAAARTYRRPFGRTKFLLPIMQLKSTWRDVAKKDGCREAAAFAVCKRSAAVKRNCLTRYEHGELLSTPRGYTWTGNRGLGYIAKRCSRLRRTQALPVGGVSRKRAIAAAKTNDDPAAMWQRWVGRSHIGVVAYYFFFFWVNILWGV